MKRALKLGRYAGIDVFVHWTFALLIAWVGFLFWRGAHNLVAVGDGILVVLGLFLCVLLHEYGHALTARRFGIGTRRITLLPFGGVALLEAMPGRPREEILIAIAGPLVNIVIAAGVALWLGAGLPSGRGFAEVMLQANLLLAAFNLLPAFPMDGGRVLRAVLWCWQSLPRATWTAAWIGRAVAVGLAIYGALHNPILVLIAAFVWYAGGAEARAVAAREARRAAARAGKPRETQDA
jgi:Zn-dependent protease